MILVFYEIIKQSLNNPYIPITLLLLANNSSTLHNMGLLDIKQTDYPQDSSVINMFCQQVAAYPNKVAMKDASTQLTYAKLNQQSDRLSY